MLHVFACLDPKMREEVFVQLDRADKLSGRNTTVVIES